MPSRQRSLVAVAFLLLVWGAGCGATDEAGTEVADTGNPDAIPGPDGLPDLGPDLAADLAADPAPDLPPPPFVRVARVNDPSELSRGFQTRAEVGDFVLENAHARFFVRGGPEPAFWGPHGGNLIDADVPRAEGDAAGDLLGELIPIASNGILLRSFRPTAFTVVHDGADGQPAVLEVHGTDAGIPLIDAALGTAQLGLDLTLTYTLAADRPLLEIRTTVTNPGPKALNLLIGDGAIFGDRLRLYYEGYGTYDEAPSSKQNLDHVLALGDGVAYGFFPAPGEAFDVPFQQAELELLQVARRSVAPGETASFARYVAVSAGDTPTLLASRPGAVASGPVLRGVVPGLPPELDRRGARVLLEDGEGTTRGLSLLDPAGAFALVAPGAGAWTVRLELEGLGASQLDDVQVPAEGRADLELPPPPLATLEAWCRAEGGDASDLPCRASLQSGLDAPLAAGVTRELYVAPGAHRFVVPAGPWTVTLSRGFEYELARQGVELAAGGEARVDLPLVRSVDTTGYGAVVVHVHSEFSIDSDLPIDVRLRALTAAGMEFVFPTDHDVFVDYQPYLEALDLGAWLTSDVGNEVSPLFGHFNCLGCTLVPGEFVVPWVQYDADGAFVRALTAPEIWADLRARFGASLVQINHPFSTQALLKGLGINAATPVAEAVSDRFTFDFDLIELYNSHDDRDELYLDSLTTWFSWLNQGVRKTGTGAEDTHNAGGTGTPRTLVALPTDAPAQMRLDDVVASLRAGRALVVQGPFPELWIDGQPVGSEVAPAAGEISLRLRVQAPSWMALGSARLIRNGEVLEVFDLEGNLQPTRLDTTLTRPENGPAWYALLVEGDAHSLAPLYGGDQPFSITNPVFVLPP